MMMAKQKAKVGEFNGTSQIFTYLRKYATHSSNNIDRRERGSGVVENVLKDFLEYLTTTLLYRMNE